MNVIRLYPYNEDERLELAIRADGQPLDVSGKVACLPEGWKALEVTASFRLPKSAMDEVDEQAARLGGLEGWTPRLHWSSLENRSMPMTEARGADGLSCSAERSFSRLVHGSRISFKVDFVSDGDDRFVLGESESIELSTEPSSDTLFTIKYMPFEGEHAEETHHWDLGNIQDGKPTLWLNSAPGKPCATRRRNDPAKIASAGGAFCNAVSHAFYAIMNDIVAQDLNQVPDDQDRWKRNIVRRVAIGLARARGESVRGLNPDDVVNKLMPDVIRQYRDLGERKPLHNEIIRVLQRPGARGFDEVVKAISRRKNDDNQG